MKHLIFVLFVTILSFTSCQENKESEFIGVFEYENNETSKVFITKDGNDYKIKSNKEISAWDIFKKQSKKKYINQKGYVLKLLGKNQLQIFHEDSIKNKKTLHRLDSKNEGLWMLNKSMSSENVQSLLGSPDSIGTFNGMTEWFYGNDKYIQFDSTGIKSFSDQFKRHKDFTSVKRGDRYETVIQKIGSPVFEDIQYVTIDYGVSRRTLQLHYSDQTRIDLWDSMVYFILLDKDKQFEESVKLIDCDVLYYEFETITDESMQPITVKEDGKIIDQLTAEYIPSLASGNITLLGKNHKIVISPKKDNTYKAIYSIRTNTSKNEDGESGVYTADDLKFTIDPELLKKGLMRGKVDLSIEEDVPKKLHIHGTFEVKEEQFE